MKKIPIWLSQLPLIFGLLFVCLMIVVAVISTEKARNHYQGKKIQEAVSNIPKAKDLAPKIDIFKDKTPTPTPIPTPKPEKSWTEKIGEYEIYFVIVALPVFFLGLKFAGLSLGVLRLKNKDLQYQTPLILINFYAMVACICLSFSLVILYLWALRVGLIG
jgi:hypothetical protein